jgi:hypothetical protein
MGYVTREQNRIQTLMEDAAPNDNIYCTATSLSGPWSAWADFATAGSNTYSSQTSGVVNINGVVMYFQLPILGCNC